MMNTSTTISTIITCPTRVVKPPAHNNYYIKNRNYTTSYRSNLLLNPLVHNNKSAYAVFRPLSCLKDNDGNDYRFTAELDLSDLHTFTSRGIKDYIPVTVFTTGFGSVFKQGLALQSGMDIYRTLGKDLVAMNFNHIVTCGAQPTLLVTRTCPTKVKLGMRRAILGCTDTCGFSINSLHIDEDIWKMTSSDIASSICYGSIEGPIIDGKNIEVGDIILCLPSYGLHAHGVIEQSGSSLKDNLLGTSVTLGESLMKPTPIYVKPVLDIIRKIKGGVKGIAYIASGGLTKNIPKLLLRGLGAVIVGGAWPVPPVFKWIQEVGRIEDAEMRRTFNMGIGMVLVTNKKNACRILLLESLDEYVFGIGYIVSGDGLTYR